MTNIRKAAVALAAGGTALGLISMGVGASFSDAGSATQTIKTGNLSCTLSSTDTAAVVSNGGHTITVNLPDIVSSAAGSAYSNVSVNNIGSMPLVVHWTEATSGTATWQPTGTFGYTLGSNGNLLSTDLTLAAGASHAYDNLGFQWTALTNADLGATASVAYTANCADVPPAPASNISFIGLATEAGHAALNLPAGAQAGDTILVLEAGSSAPATPTGYTSVQSTTAPRSATFYRTMVAGDTAVPAAATTVTDVEIAVYRGVASVGSHTSYSQNSNNVGLSGGSPLYFPLKSVPLDGVTGPAMTKTDGSSWVVNMGYDAYASTNMNLLSFNTIVSSTPTPYVVGSQDAANRPQSTDTHVGLADTGAGVATWAGGAWTSPGDNFPLPGTHGVVNQVIELLSK
jgi:predicted ribosomally synthesized peptide with SipW-like signal peptide